MRRLVALVVGLSAFGCHPRVSRTQDVSTAPTTRPDSEPRAASTPRAGVGIDAPRSVVLVPDCAVVLTSTSPPEGRLARRTIQEAVGGQTAAITACFGQALAEAEVRDETTLSARFEIGPDGRVGALCVLRRSAASSLDDCVLDRLAQVVFPPPGGVVRVTYPFVFRPADPRR